MHIPDRIRSELDAGEQVIWSGRPQQGFVLRGSDAFDVAFGLVFIGFAAFWLRGAERPDASLSLDPFGAIFLLIGVYFVVGHFFVERKRRAITFYAVTPKRIIIAYGLFRESVRSLPLNALQETALSERPDGTGTISFGLKDPAGVVIVDAIGGPDPKQFPYLRFDLIPQARNVYELILKARSNAA